MSAQVVYMPVGTVVQLPQPAAVTGFFCTNAACLSTQTHCCWMHRPPTVPRAVVPQRVFVPGQTVVWAGGNAAYLPGRYVCNPK